MLSEWVGGCSGIRRLWCDQLSVVTEPLHFACPVVRATASLKNNQAGILLGHEHRELLTRQLFSKLDLPGSQVSATPIPSCHF